MSSDIITYGSLCTGIASETAAWHSLGWIPLWFSEINPLCCSLLAEKYPNITNIGNMRSIPSGIAKPNVIVGGTPCQSFSINSGRKGLDDSRGNLSLIFVEIVERLRPNWVIWENVENTLRIEKGRVFRAITNKLVQCGYGWAYRVFNLRGFGIPQRRRRVFMVAHSGGCLPAIAALFERRTEAPNSTEIEEAWSEDMEGIRVDGWSGDETPKRGVNCIPTLRKLQGGEGVGVFTVRGVRTLTTTEIERLGGFPDRYTRLSKRSRTSPYSMCLATVGNSFPPPILHWIGKRINFIELFIRSIELSR